MRISDWSSDVCSSDLLTALLALLAAPAGLALARADAASDADFPVAGTFVVTDVVQFHVVHSLSLLSRWCRRRVAGRTGPSLSRQADYPVAAAIYSTFSLRRYPYAAPCELGRAS